MTEVCRRQIKKAVFAPFARPCLPAPALDAPPGVALAASMPAPLPPAPVSEEDSRDFDPPELVGQVIECILPDGSIGERVIELDDVDFAVLTDSPST